MFCLPMLTLEPKSSRVAYLYKRPADHKKALDDFSSRAPTVLNKDLVMFNAVALLDRGGR